MIFNELVFEIAQDMQNHGLGIFMTSNPDNRTIFTGEIPDSIPEAIMLVPVPSPPPHQYIDTEYPIIDFWARSPHSDRARALLRSIFETYHRRAGWGTANWHIYFSQALGNIVDVERDANASKLVRLSVQFYCRNLNHVS